MIPFDKKKKKKKKKKIEKKHQWKWTIVFSINCKTFGIQNTKNRRMLVTNRENEVKEKMAQPADRNMAQPTSMHSYRFVFLKMSFCLKPTESLRQEHLVVDQFSCLQYLPQQSVWLDGQPAPRQTPALGTSVHPQEVSTEKKRKESKKSKAETNRKID